VAIIGAGRVGTALAVLLERAGHRVVAASGREGSRERASKYLPHSAFRPQDEAARAAEVVILGVPDDLIAPTARALAEAGALGKGRTLIHLSGSTGLDALEAARATGSTVMSLHPLQSFPDVETGIERLPGSGIAVTGETDAAMAFGEVLARDVGGVPFRLPDLVKPLYHSAAVFASNYLVTVEGIAERVLRAAGVGDPLALLAPLARTAFDRTFALGPGTALTGPAVRGDVGTIERNLEALREGAPETVEPYVALARVAARLAAESGRLAEADRARVEEALDRWT
jgi:predicted short-subunit dehydrogenase-like oxidoreductase (DUF2520 family)